MCVSRLVKTRGTATHLSHLKRAVRDTFQLHSMRSPFQRHSMRSTFQLHSIQPALQRLHSVKGAFTTALLHTLLSSMKLALYALQRVVHSLFLSRETHESRQSLSRERPHDFFDRAHLIEYRALLTRESLSRESCILSRESHSTDVSKEALYALKRALYSIKQALYALKRVVYSLARETHVTRDSLPSARQNAPLFSEHTGLV